ncbi:MAG TPA: peptide ABC transporter substrate-binding protein [Patescibacteria group bacterium]|jgi:peptide/nickel transport system substrate-binding protein|nr:peptide ABC transporter substrate-binding protein [Patescibacteria group bacterium]
MGQREKITLAVLLVLVLASGFYSGGKLYANFTESVPANGSSYREGIIGQPRFINPLLATSETDRSIVKLVFAGLYKLDSTGAVVPDMADGMPAVSDNDQEYTVKLKANAKWHDGTPVTADDIVFTIQTLQNPDFNSPRRNEWQSTTVSKVDTSTVLFKLNTPSAPFLNNLTLPIISQKHWSSVSPSDFVLSQGNIEAVGSGPYIIKEVRKSSQGTVQTINLESFSDYHNRQAYISSVKLNFYDDIEAVLSAIHGKQIDGFGFSPFDENVRLDESNNEFKITQLDLPQYQAVFFNTSKKLFSDVQVRKALSLGTDIQTIIDTVYNGQGQPINGPILRQHVDGLPEPVISTNVEGAKAMLDAAGWKLTDGSNVRKKNGTELAFTLSTNNFSLNTKTAELLAGQWSKLGVKVTLNIQPTKELTENAIRPRNYDALLFAQKLGADPDPFLFWHSSQVRNPGLNLSLYANTNADKLMSEARAATDKTVRDEIYRQFQSVIQADAPAIFLVQNVFSYAQKSNIKGISLTSLSDTTARFYDLPNWYIDTKRVLK